MHFCCTHQLGLILCSNQNPAQERDLLQQQRGHRSLQTSPALLSLDPYLLLEFSIRKSGRVPAEVFKMRSCRHTVQTASTEPASLHPPVNIPDSDLNKAIPGYTGFIPRSKNYFGCSFSENCHKALLEFYQEKHKKDLQKSAEMPVVVNYLKQHADGLKVSLKAVSYQEFSSESAKPFIPDGNPYHLDDDNPNKYFMTGFTGHVPKARFLIGKPYSAITKQALILFGKEQSK